MPKVMKIGIYSPYFHMLGGGERYLFSIAEILSSRHQVFIFADRLLKTKVQKVFGLSLEKIQFIPNVFIKNRVWLEKYCALSSFDIFFFMTDGSLFWSPARKNILIIQSPKHLPSLSFTDRLKLYRWKIICYSDFMKKIIMGRLGRKADVLPPFIDDIFFQGKASKKENIILTVGRFFPYPHMKKQDFLIKTFKKNYIKYFRGWKLVIAGGLTEEGGKAIVRRLKKESLGYPIDIIVNPTFTELTSLYQKAKIYWHAAGVGENLDKYPERAEHFGITTLEAMAERTVPVVFNAGGQKEIVTDSKNGYLWNTEKELIDKTILLSKDAKLLNMLSERARESARNYSSEIFYEKLQQVVLK